MSQGIRHLRFPRNFFCKNGGGTPYVHVRPTIERNDDEPTRMRSKSGPNHTTKEEL